MADGVLHSIFPMTFSLRGKLNTHTHTRTQTDTQTHLVIELPDVLLNVRQQASEGELLDKEPDVVVVLQRQKHPVAAQVIAATAAVRVPHVDWSRSS